MNHYVTMIKSVIRARTGPGEINVALNTGEILALVGMGVLLFSNMGKRQVRQGKVTGKSGLGKMVSVGDFVAFGLILAGLVVMYLQK
jgi:hypothetical protein